MVPLAALLAAAGCRTSPFEQEAERALARAMDRSVERELADAETDPAPRATTREDGMRQLEIDERFLAEIRERYDPVGYEAELRARSETDEGRLPGGPVVDPVELLIGDDLLGRRHAVRTISLETAIRRGVVRNLDVQVASLGPAISEADVVAAEAAFDWVMFGGVQWEDVDLTDTGITGTQVARAEQTLSGSFGLRRRLDSGALISVQQEYQYADPRPTSANVGGDRYSHRFGVTVGVVQPLLEGFGEDVNRAEVRLARNAERRDIAALRSQLIATVTQIEQAYWQLVRARRNLIIAHKLVERGERTRDQVIARRVNEVTQAQVADAVAQVERRRGELLEARNTLRRASDQLKALINEPDAPVGDESMLLPLEPAFDEPIAFSLAESLRAALRRRPEIDRALLNIDDASIRQSFADNARLPELDLEARLTSGGVDPDLGDAYSGQWEGEFVDGFLFGLTFEQAIGNRADEATYRRTRLDRMRSVAEYRRVVQQVALDVKDSLDTLVLNYRLIDQARTSRVAQAEALRTLEIEKELAEDGFSITRLNLELSQQDGLAAAERNEIAAIVNYNIALAGLYAAMGEALERNNIDLDVPGLADLEDEEKATAYRVDGDG